MLLVRRVRILVYEHPLVTLQKKKASYTPPPRAPYVSPPPSKPKSSRSSGGGGGGGSGKNVSTSQGTTVVSGSEARGDIIKQTIIQAAPSIKQYKSIDPNAQYRLESGEVVSGAELRQIMGSSIRNYVTSGIRSGLFLPQTRSYVKSDQGYTPFSTQQRFIYEHSTPEQKQRILSTYEKQSTGLKRYETTNIDPLKSVFMGVTPTQYEFNRAYENLSTSQKEKFAYRSTNWDQPMKTVMVSGGDKPIYKQVPGDVSNIKDMPGGGLYLQNISSEKKQKLISEYQKNVTGPDIFFGRTYYKGEPIPQFGFRTGELQKIFEEQGMPRIEAIKKAGSQVYWEQITKESPGRDWFERQGDVFKVGAAFSEGVVSGLASPVTLAQTGVKLATGRNKPLLFPDVGYELSRTDMTPPGLVETGTSYFFGLGQKPSEDVIERQRKNLGLSLIKSIGGFTGSYVGFYGAGQVASGVKPYALRGFRYGYRVSGLQPRNALNVFRKVKGTYPFRQVESFTGRFADVRLARSSLRQPGMRIASKAWSGIEKSGLSEFQPPVVYESGRSVYGSFLGKIGRGRNIGTGTGTLFVRRPYGSSSYVSTLEQTIGKRPNPFMSYMPSGKFGGYETSWSYYRKTLSDPTYGVVGTRPYPKIGGQPRMPTSMSFKKTLSTEFPGKFPSEFTTSKIPVKLTGDPITGGRTPLRFYKASEIPGTIDYGYTPSGGGIGVTEGLSRLDLILLKPPVKVSFTTGRMGNIGKYTTRDLDLIDFIESGTETPSSYWTGSKPVFKTNVSGTGINMLSPLVGFGMNVFTGSINKNISSQLNSNINIQIPQTFSFEKQTQGSISIPKSITGQVLGLNSVQLLNQSQIQSGKQIQMLKMKTLSIPRETYPNSPSFSPSFIRGYGGGRIRFPWYLPDDDFDSDLKKMKFKSMKLGKGYRERTWKVPTLRQLLGA